MVRENFGSLPRECTVIHDSFVAYATIIQYIPSDSWASLTDWHWRFTAIQLETSSWYLLQPCRNVALQGNGRLFLPWSWFFYWRLWLLLACKQEFVFNTPHDMETAPLYFQRRSGSCIRAWCWRMRKLPLTVELQPGASDLDNLLFRLEHSSDE